MVCSFESVQCSDRPDKGSQEFKMLMSIKDKIRAKTLVLYVKHKTGWTYDVAWLQDLESVFETSN